MFASENDPSAQKQSVAPILQFECLDIGEAVTENRFDLRSRAIPDLQPDDCWRGPANHAQIIEIFVFGHNHEAMTFREVPNFVIAGSSQSDGLHMIRTRKQVVQTDDDSGRQVLVEKQFHDPDSCIRRSRSAAKARLA